jgi:serine/threonine protein kinase
MVVLNSSPMDAMRRQQVQRLYEEARERKPEEWSAFLREVCGGDKALREEVELLLAQDYKTEDFFPVLEKVAPEITNRPVGSLKGEIFGPYHVLSLLGAGGMGEVYRARDAKLGRDVAIKVLPEDFAHDYERVARFQREAQVLASLNHSNIGAIYDVQKIQSTYFLILELVEGETLAQRIARGPLPEHEAIEIAKQIAEALEVAHEKGIVHRDLKPSNIKITPQEKVKVLDFGLAKMSSLETSPDGLSHSTTFKAITALSGKNVIMGTVFYISPEQARGRATTKQTDIWSFGCVLFEMLTGRRAFSGETIPDTIAKVLKENPDWETLNVRPRVRGVLQRCLEKDLRRRFHDIGDVRFELEEVLNAPPAPVPVRRTRRDTVLLGGAALLLLIAFSIAFWMRSGTNEPATTWSGTLLAGPNIAIGPRVSPDGKTLAFQALVDGNSQVAVMNPNSGNWTLLTRTQNAGMVNYLSWSKDGTKIYFDRWGGVPLGIYSIPALGGEPRLLIEDAGDPDVLADGNLVVVRVNPDRAAQLHRFNPDTGELQPLNALVDMPSATAGRFRAFSDRDAVVFFGKPADTSFANTPPRLYVLDLNSNRARPIGPEPNTVSSISSLGVNPLDRSVLAEVSKGDLHQIVHIPTDGTTGTQVLMTLTEATWFLDMALDGSLYVAQQSRPMQALRFTESVQTPEPLAVVPVGVYSSPSVLELPDGRYVFTAIFDDRLRLLAAKPSGELAPFVDTREETTGPTTLVGPDQIAFVVGKPPQESIAIASIKDGGRVMKRFRIMSKDPIQSLSASPDGSTLFYSNGGSIWSTPASGGDPRRLGAGDAVAFDPSRRSLLVQLNEKVVRLVRMPLTGGSAEPIPINSDLQIPANSILGSNAVRMDGQIVVAVASRDSWFYGAAILDPASGMLRKVPLRYDGDLFSLSWNQRNEIIAGGFLMRGSIWHFRPERRKE